MSGEAYAWILFIEGEKYIAFDGNFLKLCRLRSEPRRVNISFIEDCGSYFGEDFLFF